MKNSLTVPLFYNKLYYIYFFQLRTNIKMNTRQFLNTYRYYLHALAKSATAEGIELLSLSGIVRNLTAELLSSAYYICQSPDDSLSFFK